MARTLSEFATLFVMQLEARHGSEKRQFGVEAGNKFDKITVTNWGQNSVHAFVEKSTGHVYKAAGWAQPAKGVRFLDVFAASEASDPHGGYLYAQ